MTPKAKSNRRFEQLNKLADEITPTLPTPAHVAVLLICFRHGHAGGMFRVSTARIAKSVALKPRRVQLILNDLERLGVIIFVKEHEGPLPRQYKITGKAANGALQCTISRPENCESPQPNGASQCA